MTCLYCLTILIHPPASAYDMFKSLIISNGTCDIMTGSLMVGENAAEAKDSVPTLEDLCGIYKKRAKVADVFERMKESIKLGFHDNPFWINQCPDIKNVVDKYL